MDYSQESQDRMKKIQALKDAGVIVYANNYHGKMGICDIEARKNEAKEVETLMAGENAGTFQTAGRIMLSRGMGKLLFAKIQDHTGAIQVCFMKDAVLFHTGKPHPTSPYQGEEQVSASSLLTKEGIEGGLVTSLLIEGEEKSAFKIAEKFCQMGDYIGVKGDLFFTKHGELTIFVKEFQILSKAVRPLPEKFHGIQDQETIYRQRYLDMIMNQESFDRFKLRSKFIKALRDFYFENEFFEIETPVLGNAASGAAAAPFTTHHNDFNEDFFLRISPETALKKATVGRFERVVEFTRNFRNEGSDPSHMQEFSAIEHYACWWNYEDNMRFTEAMFDFVFSKIPELSREVMVKDKNGVEKQVSFQTPWARIDYIAGVKEKSGIDVSLYGPQDEEKFRAEIKKAGYSWEGIDKQVTATMIDYLYKKVLRPGIVGPAFVYNYPKTMQPLARGSDANPEIVEQWQLVINGWEVIKAYSELVDPKIQKQNFDDQADAIAKGDAEATSSDDDFVLAMEYGMPPQSGWGMGIERVLALLTGQENLRDMVLFPLMKSDTNQDKKRPTKVAVALLNTESGLEKWQELNTVAHLSAALAAREGKSLLMQDSIETADEQKIALNIQDAIMIRKISGKDAMVALKKQAQSQCLTVTEFTREMLQTSDDLKLMEMTKQKSYADIEYLGILIYGEKKQVESVTKQFELYK